MPDLHLATGAYALDAMDDVERRAFERHLSACPDCAAQVVEFAEATAMLAEWVAAEPPATLRPAVLGQITRTRQVAPSRTTLPRFSWRSIVTVAAAVIITAGAALGGAGWQGHQADRNAQTQAAAYARVFADPTRIQAQAKTSVGGNTTVVSSGGTAVFAADGLPAAPAGRTYQLWVVQGRSIRSAGLFTPTNGAGQALITDVPAGADLAVTLEPEGGSKQPTTRPVVNLHAV